MNKLNKFPIAGIWHAQTKPSSEPGLGIRGIRGIRGLHEVRHESNPRRSGKAENK